MNISTEKTVREYALEMPQATRIFEKLKIDYCCGGGRSIGAACDAAGVQLDELARLLENAGTTYMPEGVAARVHTGTLAELIDYIIDKHHVFTREEMERIDALLDKVCFKHGESHPEVVHARTLFRRLCDDLKPHMFKEEAVLFPYIKALEEAARRGTAMPFAPFGTVNNPVRMVMFEHDTAGDILRELRAATKDYALPADACLSFRTLYDALENFEQDLHQHIHLENNVLFPRAVKLEGETGKR
ncbi:MAG TPA: iron-sulfur cluster repair di-iron protein [Pyrinomonadaceae bacterium]|nr:iron-sulfur cluster repair di-iron protein [Pyrinomonadaceae bacterium]